MAVVKSGDNLSKIARQYGLSVLDLIAANPGLVNPNLIRPGQEINIPDEPASQRDRNIAGNILASAPSAEDVQSAAESLYTQQGFYPTLAAANFAARQVAPALAPGTTVAPTTTVAPIVGPGGHTLGQAFPRSEATLTPQGTVATGAAAMRAPTLRTTPTTIPSYPRTEPTRGQVTMTPPQLALYERMIEHGKTQEEAMARIRELQATGPLEALSAAISGAPKAIASAYARDAVERGLRAFRQQVLKQKLDKDERDQRIQAERARLEAKYGVTSQPTAQSPTQPQLSETAHYGGVLPLAASVPGGTRTVATAAGGRSFAQYLDRLQSTDPQRAAEVARFTAAQENNKSFVDDLGQVRITQAGFDVAVFFTERAYLDQNLLPNTATENIWDAIARRQGWDITGAEALQQWGYEHKGGGVWEHTSKYQVTGYGGGTYSGGAVRQAGGGSGGGGDGSGSRAGAVGSYGLVSWRISAGAIGR